MKDKMMIIDPHIHMTSRTTDDYEAMAEAGIVAIIEPSFWLGQPRTQVGSFQDYYSSLVGWEPFRASQFGIKHYCTIGLNSKEANNEALAEKFRTQTDKHPIVVDFPPGFPVVVADEDRLGQVLSNLLSNAIKYSPAGGEIRIVGQVRPDQIIICVQDQGPGIAPGDIPHIFDRFYRSDSASRTTKGAGLGLYLTRAVVEAHFGRIWVDPRPEGGARICFSPQYL